MRKISARASGSRTVAAKLSKLGIRREFDLVLHLPLRYEDETRVTSIANAPPGVPVQVEGTVRSTEIVYRPRRQLFRGSRIQRELAPRFFISLEVSPGARQERREGARIR